MRYGVPNDTLNPAEDVGDIFVDQGSGGFLPYNETSHYLHWREFTNALGEYKHCLNCLQQDADVSCYFSLQRVELSNTVVEMLSTALKNTYFRGFHLEDNRLGREGWKFALNYVQSNPIMTNFISVENRIDCNTTLSRLCDIIRVHPSLVSIRLNGCNSDEITGYVMLREIIYAGGEKLKELDLSNNNIMLAPGIVLYDFLRGNPKLQKLSLEDNRLGDLGAISIARALRENTNLYYLDLSSNPIPEEACEVLREVEFDDSSLKTAASSNHTCRIVYPDGNWGFNDGDYPETDKPYGKKLIRAQKIYTVLSVGNEDCENVQEVKEAPLEALPIMLKSIQDYSNYHVGSNNPDQLESYVQPLSVVYEIMRGWEEVVSHFETMQ